MPSLFNGSQDQARGHALLHSELRLCGRGGLPDLRDLLPLGDRHRRGARNGLDDEDVGQGGQAAVFLTGLGDRFLHHATIDEALELLVRAETHHLFAAAGGLPGAQIRLNELEKGFKFDPGRSGEDGDQFLRHYIRAATRGITAKLCSHHQL